MKYEIGPFYSILNGTGSFPPQIRARNPLLNRQVTLPPTRGVTNYPKLAIKRFLDSLGVGGGGGRGRMVLNGEELILA